MKYFKLDMLEHKYNIQSNYVYQTQNAIIEEVNKVLEEKGYTVELKYCDYDVEGDAYNLAIYKKFDGTVDFIPNSYYATEWCWESNSEEIKEFMVFNIYHKLLKSDFFKKLIL